MRSRPRRTARRWSPARRWSHPRQRDRQARRQHRARPRCRRVHYRSDSVLGLFVGEQQALGLLRDYSRTYNERFDGFIVRKFNGEKVKIASGEAQPL